MGKSRDQGRFLAQVGMPTCGRVLGAEGCRRVFGRLPGSVVRARGMACLTSPSALGTRLGSRSPLHSNCERGMGVCRADVGALRRARGTGVCRALEGHTDLMGFVMRDTGRVGVSFTVGMSFTVRIRGTLGGRGESLDGRNMQLR